MNLKNRWVWVGIIAVAAIVLLSLFAAPQSTKLQQGSTYSRAPSGYGAWYAYMEQQSLPIQRWRRPLSALIDRSPPAPVKQIAFTQAPVLPMTLIQISDGGLSLFNEDWVRQGNLLVLVGMSAPVTQASFRSALASPVGAVKIATTRRYAPNQAKEEKVVIRPLLSDEYGAVVWEQQLGKGRVIYAATAYLAANAYQNEPGNFKYLAQLVSRPGYPIYVDEYLHGYQDQETIAQGNSASLIDYLAKTPLLLLSIQAGVILLVLIWGQNQRFGPVQKLAEPPVDNSAAYIEALAGVLQKADCSDFVVETIGKAEQIKIQRNLGLGATPLNPQTIIDAWVQQTNRPAAELQNWLEPLLKSRQLSSSELRLWLEQLQTLRRRLE